MEGAMAEAPRKILIVEDEEDIRSLVRYNLEAEGFAVVDASDGERGLHLAAKERPALIILDLMLPGLSGLEVWSSAARPGGHRLGADSDF